MWSYTLTPSPLLAMVSRFLTLTLPYDNYAMYAFTYATVTIRSLSEARYHSQLVLYVRAILSMDNVLGMRSCTDVDGRCVR
jgi:hypothetical protein